MMLIFLLFAHASAWSGSSRQPIRIHPFYQNMSTGTGSMDEAIKQQTNKAIETYASMLLVDRVNTNLTFHRSCLKTTDKICHKYQTEYQHDIPTAWWKKVQGCDTCVNNSSQCCTNYPGGVGFSETDLVILVTTNNTDICKRTEPPPPSAYAGVITRDQYDRPTLGYINFCVDIILQIETENLTPYILRIAKHEVGHALGFIAASIPLMHDGITGLPRTERDATTNLPPKGDLVCSDGETRSVFLANTTTTLQGPITVRDMINTFRLITPAVQRVARKYFGCDTMLGLELSPREIGSSGGCYQGHWDQCLVWGDIMSYKKGTFNLAKNVRSDITSRPAEKERSMSSSISEFTLAFFEDTGWYDVRYDKAEPINWVGKDGQKMSTGPGFHAGCPWVTKERCERWHKFAYMIGFIVLGICVFCCLIVACVYRNTGTPIVLVKEKKKKKKDTTGHGDNGVDERGIVMAEKEV